jgi:hypothetical protein
MQSQFGEDKNKFKRPLKTVPAVYKCLHGTYSPEERKKLKEIKI